MQHLKNKTAIITGASRGIGEAAARLLAAQGANVVLAARSDGDINRIAEDIKKNGGSALAVACDVSDHAQILDLFSATKNAFGGVDILVNNAGVIDPISRLADSDPAAWSQAVDINVKGVYFGIRSAIPEMLKRGGGTIINISSGAAAGALEGWSHYCATKAAVLSLTRCVHKEYGDQGIRMIGLSPGTVATKMQVDIKASGVNPVSQLDPSVHIPAEWVAKAIGALCGPLGDDYLGVDFLLKTDEGRQKLGLPLT